MCTFYSALGDVSARTATSILSTRTAQINQCMDRSIFMIKKPLSLFLSRTLNAACVDKKTQLIEKILVHINVKNYRNLPGNGFWTSNPTCQIRLDSFLWKTPVYTPANRTYQLFFKSILCSFSSFSCPEISTIREKEWRERNDKDGKKAWKGRKVGVNRNLRRGWKAKREGTDQ